MCLTRFPRTSPALARPIQLFTKNHEPPLGHSSRNSTTSKPFTEAHEPRPRSRVFRSIAHPLARSRSIGKRACKLLRHTRLPDGPKCARGYRPNSARASPLLSGDSTVPPRRPRTASPHGGGGGGGAALALHRRLSCSARRKHGPGVSEAPARRLHARACLLPGARRDLVQRPDVPLCLEHRSRHLF